MVMSIKHKVYHIIWNDASEGESHDDINSEKCCTNKKIVVSL